MLKFNNINYNNLFYLFKRSKSNKVQQQKQHLQPINNIMKQNIEGPLSKEDLEHFNEYGYVVVKSGLIEEALLTNHQVEIREFLKKNALIDFGTSKIGSKEEALLLNKQESKLSNVSNGFGGMVNFYHGKSEYKIRENENLYNSFAQLFKATYSSSSDENQIYNDDNEWANEYGNFDPYKMYMFINRCGFRIPTIVEKQEETYQKGTGLHLDCNPYHLFRGEKINQDTQLVEQIPLRFWQPIQAFVSCTDTLNEGQGGFWTVPKFHKKCVKYFNQHKQQQTLKRGNAYDFQDGQHLDVLRELAYIPIKRGEVLFWDWRMPHCNDTVHNGPSIREVVYAAHLPMVSVNSLYAENQKVWYQTGRHPNYVAKKYADLETVDYSPPQLTDLGKKLLGIEPFDKTN